MNICSLNTAKKYLMRKGLIDKNMTLTSSTSKVSSAINKLTSIAKSNYYVDRGPLFSMRQELMKNGGYNIKLIPNEGAFSDIDSVSELQNISRIPYNLDSKVDVNIIDLEEEGTILISYMGENIGHIYGAVDGSYFNVEMANIDSRYTGRGIGTISYIKAGRELNKLGLALRSDRFERMSDSATGMWDKLVNVELAIKGEERYELIYVNKQPNLSEIPNSLESPKIEEGDLPSIDIKC